MTKVPKDSPFEVARQRLRAEPWGMARAQPHKAQR